MPLSKLSRSRSRFAVLPLTLFLLLSGTGCGSVDSGSGGPGDNRNGRFVSAAEMPALVQKSIADFPEPLPPGVKWFRQVPAHLTDPNTKYEPGVADWATAFYWLCSWESRYIKSFNSSDEPLVSKSLTMVARWTDLPVYKAHMEDPDKGWLREVLRPAQLGDPSGIKREFQSEQCALFAKENPAEISVLTGTRKTSK